MELEITETLAMSDTIHTAKQVQALFDYGFSLAIDDFGTGHSSLSYLKRFPFSKLKIDRSFIIDLDQDTGDAAIIEAMIQLAHTLGLKVIAEGVETESQRVFLEEKECDFIQGYLIAKPMPMEKFEEWLKA